MHKIRILKFNSNPTNSYMHILANVRELFKG